MIGAYYSKAVNSKEVCENLKISHEDNYKEYLNKYNVISISFNEIPDNMKSYDDYINNIINELKKELINNEKSFSNRCWWYKNLRCHS